ncbi:MAG: hypothetical protein K0Q52_3315 [Microbacterium sp.]|jgi:hypothetical protein|nr:hypothetical protein [Microbacterium sp.]
MPAAPALSTSRAASRVARWIVSVIDGPVLSLLAPARASACVVRVSESRATFSAPNTSPHPTSSPHRWIPHGAPPSDLAQIKDLLSGSAGASLISVSKGKTIITTGELLEPYRLNVDDAFACRAARSSCPPT